ncbi:MAG: dephospho-CoA kinase [Chloroflexota bacterium]|nr:dephospho-CoA kinase [Chloroflexota bacterium]
MLTCIGLTGNIATGKSTVARILVEWGAQHIDADHVAHELLAPHGAAYTAVVNTFGKSILLPGSAEIERRALGAIVFTDPAALARLEALVHPAVLALVDQSIVASQAPVVVVEAIKLLESGLATNYTAIWVTTCSPAIQRERLMSLRKLSRAAAEQRIAAQPPQAEKLAQADVIIQTGGSLAATRAQVQEAWLRLVRS